MSPVYASLGAGRPGRIDFGSENLQLGEGRANGDRDWVLCDPFGDAQLTHHFQWFLTILTLAGFGGKRVVGI